MLIGRPKWLFLCIMELATFTKKRHFGLSAGANPHTS